MFDKGQFCLAKPTRVNLACLISVSELGVRLPRPFFLSPDSGRTLLLLIFPEPSRGWLSLGCSHPHTLLLMGHGSNGGRGELHSRARRRWPGGCACTRRRWAGQAPSIPRSWRRRWCGVELPRARDHYPPARGGGGRGRRSPAPAVAPACGGGGRGELPRARARGGGGGQRSPVRSCPRRCSPLRRECLMKCQRGGGGGKATNASCKVTISHSVPYQTQI
jgi:hypothetical protein